MGANGDKNETNGDPLSPIAMPEMAPMVHPITIGDNGDRHWSPFAPFKWRQ